MNDDLIDIVMNIHKFNQDLTSLNIKYAQTIEEHLKEIERLNNIIMKAINLIEEYNGDFSSFEAQEVLEILKGSDKE